MQGSFQKGDVVEVFGMNGLIGKGEVTYSSADLMDVIGTRSEERKKRASATQVEVIHRDKWVRI